MPLKKPIKNGISFVKEFKTLCIPLTERQKRRATLDDIREWLAPPAVDCDEGGGDEDLDVEKLHYVRKILKWKRVNGKTYYLAE
ncbi:Hypothetical protein PHPALM_12415 [Phytophthora palmivora]|uniref:Uncharacterized protein n=1 Tax=Phytophthora palmivora TaxID=4796 RepID=A0A2P4XZU2_9STRA|nr:Hypothetical protein PHPALM_12415 [Phytophthora palmivora]